jgi:acetyl-CoA carboxylase biotin carboxyl carrier protein
LDLKQIKQIIDLMKRSDLTEFEVEEEGFKIKIKRGLGEQSAINSPVLSAHPFPTLLPAAPEVKTPGAPVAAAPAPATASANGEESGFAYVKSPMVGTFYRGPSPDSPPFADINTKVEEKTVVCIIEAMKIMNEIQAETKGTVVEILVENGQPVEYGQRLFKIKSA